MHRRMSVIGLVMVGAALFGVAAFAAEPQFVAKITKMTGTVTIISADPQKPPVKPMVVAGQVKQGGLTSGDRVQTASASSAFIEFTDGTTLDLGADTDISIAEVLLKRPPRGTNITTDRKIAVHLGKVLWDVKRSETTQTKFELPSGVAAVRGTSGSFVVTKTERGTFLVTFSLNPGTPGQLVIQVFATVGDKSVAVAQGVVMQGQGSTYVVEASKISLNILPTSTTPVTFTTPEGNSITIPPAGGVDIQIAPDGKITVTATSGTITITNAATGQTTTLQPGQTQEVGKVIVTEPEKPTPTPEPTPNPHAHT